MIQRTEKEENRIFNEAKDGYGFDEVPHQNSDGIYCTGCYAVHKRPTKMYTNGRDTLCKSQVILLYNPEK